MLNRMRALGFVSDAQYRDALDAPNTARLHGQQTDLEAAYIAEMARAYMQEKFGDLAQSEGFSVYTTVDSRLQHAATQAARGAIIAYDERHGYRGPEDHVALADETGPEQFATLLDNVIELGELVPALVTGVQPQAVDVYIRNVGAATIPWQGLSWARKYLGTDRYGVAPESAGQIAAVGDIIRVRAV
ncbi:MAG: peptidase, partial [Halieaceae bacterium]|nr:peptidase [Halieaceae bacterium]